LTLGGEKNMSNDPLAAFRRQQPQPTGEQSMIRSQPPAKGLKSYEAYKAQDAQPERLKIRRVLGDWRAPGYRYLMDVSWNGDFQTKLALIFSMYTVEITGKNLNPVIYAIVDGHCDFIQDFDAREFAAPADPKQPVIEEIKFIVGSEDNK